MNVCCFIGHRTINETEELKLQLCEIIEKLIADENVETFLFGSKSRFNDLCYELVTKYKEQYPHIKRVCVVYCDERNTPTNRKSGTMIALNYAIKQGKEIIKLP